MPLGASRITLAQDPALEAADELVTVLDALHAVLVAFVLVLGFGLAGLIGVAFIKAGVDLWRGRGGR